MWKKLCLSGAVKHEDDAAEHRMRNDGLESEKLGKGQMKKREGSDKLIYSS